MGVLGRWADYARRNAVAWVALAVALSGTAYAAIQLPRNSVGSRELKRDAVKAAELSDRAITLTVTASPPTHGDPGTPSPTPTTLLQPTDVLCPLGWYAISGGVLTQETSELEPEVASSAPLLKNRDPVGWTATVRYHEPAGSSPGFNGAEVYAICSKGVAFTDQGVFQRGTLDRIR